MADKTTEAVLEVVVRQTEALESALLTLAEEERRQRMEGANIRQSYGGPLLGATQRAIRCWRNDYPQLFGGRVERRGR